MTFDVILLKQADDGYLARPVLWPDSVVHGTTEEEALERVRTLIRDLLIRTQFVQVEVDVPARTSEDPWLAKAGLFVNDPTWAGFLEAMAEYRRDFEQVPRLTIEKLGSVRFAVSLRTG